MTTDRTPFERSIDAIDDAITTLCDEGMTERPDASANTISSLTISRGRLIRDQPASPHPVLTPDAALRARVLAVMMDIDDKRTNDIRDMEMLEAGDEERYGRLDARATNDGKTLEALRVALGLPCEWREAVTS